MSVPHRCLCSLGHLNREEGVEKVLSVFNKVRFALHRFGFTNLSLDFPIVEIENPNYTAEVEAKRREEKEAREREKEQGAESKSEVKGETKSEIVPVQPFLITREQHSLCSTEWNTPKKKEYEQNTVKCMSVRIRKDDGYFYPMEALLPAVLHEFAHVTCPVPGTTMEGEACHRF